MKSLEYSRFRRRGAGGLFFGLALGATSLCAELLVHEPFDYERRQWYYTETIPGDPPEVVVYPGDGIHGLDGGIGFSGPWAKRATGLNAGIPVGDDDFVGGSTSGARTAPLSYVDSHGNALVTMGNQVRTAFGNNSWDRRPFATPLGQPGTTVWMSFMGQLNGIPNAADTRWSFVELSDGRTADNNHQVWIGKVTPVRTGHWGINLPGNPVGPTEGDFGGPIMVNEPTMILVKLEFPENEWEGTRIRVWLNPSDLTDEEALPEAVFNDLTRYIQYTHLGVAGRYSGDFDEIRIGTTFDSVTPSEFVAPPTDAPRLAIARDGNNVLVSWPAAAVGYTLYSSQDLISWAPVAETPVVQGDFNIVEIEANIDRIFFRLQP